VLKTIKAGAILFVALVVSRLLPLPANSEPLLGLAVVAPYLTKSNIGLLLPVLVMFVSDLFLPDHGSKLLTYSAIGLAPFISKLLHNKIYTSLFCSWLVWHVIANFGQWYPPFSSEALLFDIRMLLSGLSIVLLYDIRRRLWQTAYQEV
jgi:hypothetical protein